MIGWRLIKSRYANDPLSIEGAMGADGRWHFAGTPILYCSEHLSLAALEVLVHLAPDSRHASFLALEIEVEIVDELSVTRWEVEDLPIGWRSVVGNPECRGRGTSWANARSALMLSVPSAVVAQERNLLLNALHPAFAHVRVKSREPFAFDPPLIPSVRPKLIPSAPPDTQPPSRRRSPRRAGGRRS